MTLVDARGKLCPQPIIMTKKTLREGCKDFVILLDNETAKENVLAFLEDNNIECSCIGEAGSYEISVGNAKYEEKKILVSEKSMTEQPSENVRKAIVIKNNRMGQGNDDLGRILLESFINILPDMDGLPTNIVFYNAGIFMVVDETPVIKALRKLENEGVRLLVCGACLDFYDKKKMLKVGKVSNMYDILECLNASTTIIYP
jgi:selenium metabolism protein YedF